MFFFFVKQKAAYEMRISDWSSDVCSSDLAPNGETRHISYAALLADVIRFANTLRKMGVQRGDRVTIYMPMIPEGAVAMLACARIGAVHSVIFGGFSPDAIAGRIEDCASDWGICADEGLRGGRTIPLKANVDKALEKVDVKIGRAHV